MTPRQYAELARVVPRVAPVRPLVASAVLAGAFVLTAPSAAVASMRVRIAAALVAAAAAFVLDDEAVTTLAPAPVSLFTRRVVRVAAAMAFVALWLAVVIVTGDALTGVGRPPIAALAEACAIALVAVAAACLAIGRTDDGRGGIAGAIVALVCFATVYLPPRWWWPLTPRPETTRLAVIGIAALAVALAASADPARPPTRSAVRRRRWLG